MGASENVLGSIIIIVTTSVLVTYPLRGEALSALWVGWSSKMLESIERQALEICNIDHG